MYIVDRYLRVRRACLVEGMSIREASRVFGMHRGTVRKMLKHPVPPEYRRCRRIRVINGTASSNEGAVLLREMRKESDGLRALFGYTAIYG